MTAPTLEQQRAADAWQKAQGCSTSYRNLAKGLPALIMNSGLMQVLAFLHEKGQKDTQRHCRQLGTDLRDWLHRCFKSRLGSSSNGFNDIMQALMNAEPRLFQQVTTEALAWLRWSRQMAAAACADPDGKD